MKKYKINYCYDDESKMFVGTCKEFFGFILYCPTLTELKTNVIKTLKVYTKDNTIEGKNVEFNEIELTQQDSITL